MLCFIFYMLFNIYYLTYYVSIISTYIMSLYRYNDTVYHSGQITLSYSQNLVYLLSGNRCNIKHQGKTSLTTFFTWVKETFS